MSVRSRSVLAGLLVAVVTWFTGTAQAYWYYEDLKNEIAEATSVEAAVESIQEVLRRHHYEIVLVVDHAAAAASVGLELRPTQVIFARPHRRLERALLNRLPTLGIDLPLKYLVFEDVNGAVQVRGNPASYLSDRHNAKLYDPLLWFIDRTNDKVLGTENGLVTKPSNRSVADTVKTIIDALLETGSFRIPLTLEYADSRHERAATLIVFGNPNAGTPLMQATQEAAIDLPQKFLIWEDRRGNVHITYNDPFFVAKRHNIQVQDPLLTNITNALAAFASKGAE